MMALCLVIISETVEIWAHVKDFEFQGNLFQTAVTWYYMGAVITLQEKEPV